MADNVESGQYSNDVMEEMAGKKQLEYNQTKSCFLVIGSKKARKSIDSQLEKAPLTFCGSTMNKVKVLKYLGDSISFSCEDSVHQTIVQRIGMVKHSIQELRAIIEDRRAQSLRGLNVAFMIWEQSIVPTL